MAIRLHSFISFGKRYIQVESQPHHITGIFKKLIYSTKNLYPTTLENAESEYFECEEDGTITFYQAASNGLAEPGVWTYLVYECPENEEKVFSDLSIDTSTHSLNYLFSGGKLVHIAFNINDYLQCQRIQDEYLEIQLPDSWNTHTGRQIANLLVEELRAFQSSSVFAEGVGKEYMRDVMRNFITIAQQVLEIGGNLKSFELAQYEVLSEINIDAMAKLILEYNDYRIWQAALPSKSKAVEHAFHKALNLICRIN